MDVGVRRERYTAQLASLGQEHVLRFWADLTEDQQRALLDDLDCVDVSAATAAVAEHLDDTGESHRYGPLEPAPFLPQPAPAELAGRYAAARAMGEELIGAGKVAALTVAGGQGTRLGFDGPKGAYPMAPVTGKTLFQWFAEAILNTRRRYDAPLPWYIMTSPANDAATRAFFAEHACFGLPAEDVVFFQQGVMPAFDMQGKLLLAAKHRLALSPDGHGGTLLALAKSGALADMASRGVEVMSYFQVDNPLVRAVDPLFVGLHAESGSEMSSKCLTKRDDFERVGNFVIADGRLMVIEYSDMPCDLATARDADGGRQFNAGSPAIHVISRTFVERLTGSARFGLPWHRANKKVPCVDDAGRAVEPDAPNGIKLESFIFDALPLAKQPLILQALREEEFSPVKNATGEDSLETCQRDLIRRSARWLEAAGAVIPRQDDGQPDAQIEISPLLAVEAAQLRGGACCDMVIARGRDVYLA